MLIGGVVIFVFILFSSLCSVEGKGRGRKVRDSNTYCRSCAPCFCEEGNPELVTGGVVAEKPKEIDVGHEKDPCKK